MRTLITNGRVIDPATALDKQADVAIANGKVLAIGGTPADFEPERTLDAQGCLVLPGLVDLAARLREPGYEHERMLESEMAAAAAGGVTSLVCRPTPIPCSTSRAWSRCSSSAPRKCRVPGCSHWAR